MPFPRPRDIFKAGAPRHGDLTSGDVPALVLQLAVPASVGFFFSTMYNVVDTYFAGLLSTDAVAALSLSFPLFFLIISMGGGLSAGGTALMGTALGQKDQRKAALFAMQGISFSLLASVLVAVLGFIASPFLFRLLGAREEYLELSLAYMNPIFAGTAFFLLVQCFNSVLNARGDTRSFRNFLVLGFVLNCVLDPWFVFGGLGVPAMGVGGIALATVLVQAVGCVYMGRRACGTGLLALSSWRDLLPRAEPFKEIARQGLPASFNYFTIGLGIFVITYYVSLYGKEAVAAYGIGTRVVQIALLPAIGLNISTLALTAQNSGALLFQRVRQARSAALRYGAMAGGAGMLFVFVFAAPLMELFTKSAEVVDMGVTYLRIEGLALYGYVVLTVCVSMMQGLKRPMFGVWVGLARQIVAPVAVFHVLTRVLHVELFTIWWGIAAIVWSAALFALIYTGRKLRRLERRSV